MTNKLLTIKIPLVFAFALVELVPATDIGEGWKFAENEVHGGPAKSDGITAFAEIVERASMLSKEEGRALLFASGIAEGGSIITGEDRLKALAGRNHADPDLLWSLFKEDGQKTLRYLHDTYGVVWMEGLHRILVNPNGDRCGFYLYRGVGGSWYWSYNWLDDDRDTGNAALVLG